MRTILLRNPVAFLCLIITLSFLFVTIISLFKLPDQQISLRRRTRNFETSEIGPFGETMVDMLPQDLAFTVFAPSDRAVRTDLGLKLNGTVLDDDNTYAVVSRILGFSVIPRTVMVTDLVSGEELCYASLSGLTLCVRKDGEGALVVNGVKAEKMEVKRGKILVYVMDGAIMDAEFEQSITDTSEEER